MSSLREQLVAQIRHFDDEAFAALANRGLVRRARKDLEKQPAELVDETPDALIFAFGEHRIRFDARGAAHAQCTCPAAGVCHHILAAAIGLQNLDHGMAEPSVVPDEEPDPLAALHASLQRISHATLIAHAGKAVYRWAWQFVQDIDVETGLKIGGTRYLVLSLDRPRMSFRYMGGGLDGLIADSDAVQAEKYRVAIVLAYQRASGVEITAPAPAVKSRSEGLDFGKDHADGSTGSEDLSATRAGLSESARQLFAECMTLGLSHLSRSVYERYATLAVWAQGAQYHRLAAFLRRIADHVELLLTRAGGADEHRLLDELALAYGLVSALDEAARLGKAPAGLVGRARTQYEESGEMSLLGLGAQAWRSGSGYIGLTMMFWSSAEQAFFSWTDARPESQRAFDPVARYKAAGPWAGLAAPEQATGSRIVLRGAKCNEQGRLSASDGTSATVSTLKSVEDFAAMLPACSVWSTLRASRSFSRRSLLSQPQPMKDWAVLRPQRFGTAKFDSVRQVLVWPLFDTEDQCLDVEVVFSDQTKHLITRIEQIRPGDLKGGTMIVARVNSVGAKLVAEPLSLVRSDTPADVNPVDALYFDEPPQAGFVSAWWSKWRGGTTSSSEVGEAIGKQVQLPYDLVAFRQWLQRWSERGVSPDQVASINGELRTWMQRLGRAGLTGFQRIAPHDSCAVLLLRAHYVCVQYERLIAGGDGSM